uniref:Uncharacterized protein n=1 Tax=Opuntia streptacantha TaxID=393608 RepID=A0A7C9AL78_OPUST
MEKAIFWITFHWAFLASFMAWGIFLMSFDMRTTCPVSVASAEPETPIEIPTSAMANAGASFTPSPTIAVGPSSLYSWMILALSSGKSSACTRSKACPSCSCACIAADLLSPVSKAVLMPIDFNSLIASVAPERQLSERLKVPMRAPLE